MQNQTYPAKHYIFVDGGKYHDKAREILVKYPEVIVTYLPMNTGAGGWTNSAINAIAPYLIKEDQLKQNRALKYPYKQNATDFSVAFQDFRAIMLDL